MRHRSSASAMSGASVLEGELHPLHPVHPPHPLNHAGRIPDGRADQPATIPAVNCRRTRSLTSDSSDRSNPAGLVMTDMIIRVR